MKFEPRDEWRTIERFFTLEKAAKCFGAAAPSRTKSRGVFAGIDVQM